MTIGDGGSAATPGWYPDGPGWERRWDGTAWTSDRRPTQQAQPPQPPQPAAPPTQVGRSPWAPPSSGPPAGDAAPPTMARPASPPPGFPAGPPAGPPPAGSPAGPPPSSAPRGPSYSPPGGPSSYPAPPRQQKKSLLWLWIALAVVGVVVVATVVTLVVVQPWADDTDRDAKRGGETETTGPTTEPPAADGARGDIDGDGRGDVIGRFYDDSAESRLTLTNADGSFEVERKPVPQEEHLAVADFDGDGVSDVGSWFDSAGTLQFEVEDSELPSVTQDFELWSKVEFINAGFGDFDGDGLTDIVAYGQRHRSQVAVWVLRNTGEGFEAPKRWASLPNATYGSTELVVGDFNGDGSDDAMAVVPDEPLVKGDYDSLYWYGDFGVVPLIAEPGAFRRGGIGPIETELFGQEHAVGDFDGDGKETLVADNYFEDTFVLYEYDGTTLRPTGGNVSYSVSGDGVMDGVTVVDLDGDQLDDLVFSSVDIDDYSFLGVWVATADAEGGIDTPVKWADLPDCSGDYCEVDYFDAR